MLKKLLKYDFKSVYKYWWIAAATSVALSVLGGFCLTVIRDANSFDDSVIEPPAALSISSSLLFALSIIGLCAFSITSFILIYVRYYKNFFTDEGYLTFTLPVKRTQLLNSKLILSGVTNLVTFFAITIDIVIMVCIGYADKIFTKEFLDSVEYIFRELWGLLKWYLPLYILEGFALIVLSIVFSALFTFACITFASMITKRAKLITAIGIYYGANGIFTFIIQIFYLFSLNSISTHFAQLSEVALKPVLALALLVAILLLAMFSAILYTFVYWMLDRKLNLA